MSQAHRIAVAESCSLVRTAAGRILTTREDTPERLAAEDAYRRALRHLLRLVRESECGLYLEVAGELASRD